MILPVVAALVAWFCYTSSYAVPDRQPCLDMGCEIQRDR